jgi:glutamine kinase
MASAPLKSDTTRFARLATRENHLVFGTKAETLERLRSLVRASTVPDLLYFTLADWKRDRPALVARIQERFGRSRLAIRSSARNEDSVTQSLAGAFRSVLQIDAASPEAIARGVEQVFESYRSTNPHNQVLVQPMLEHIAASGVATTHDLTNGAPYYIINYDDESGRTDVITGGTGVNKTVVVHRDAPDGFIVSDRIAGVLRLVRELEQLTGGRTPLDIEFAQTKDGALHLLQVRQIVVQKNWNRAVRTRLSEALEQIEQFFCEHARPRLGLPGGTTVLGQMPDWNPAELIGTEPGPLAVSLFRYLITDSVWQEARALMGYRPVPDEPLLVSLGGRPYIDVRNSFSSFLPDGLPAPLENALVNAWLERLGAHPEYHDKVEFEVALTVFDFCFETNLFSRYAAALSAEDRQAYTEAVRTLTVNNVTTAPEGTLAHALQRIRLLQRSQQHPDLPGEPLRQAFHLLAECRQYGTSAFSTIARHAFMAEALCRSAVRRGAWKAKRLEEFKRSLVTPAGQMSRDFATVIAGRLTREQFLARYGHLRPGTFDIISPRYDQREELFRDSQAAAQAPAPGAGPFQLAPDEHAAFTGLLTEARLPLSPEALLDYAGQAIVGREQAKFVFTRHLSDALESIAEWGEHIGLTREDLAFLTLRDLEETLTAPVTRDRETHFHELAQSRRTYAREMRGLRLGYIVRDVHDLYVVPQHRGAANYVTTRSLEGRPALLDNRMTGPTDLFGQIVCIESADPGFDWIFTKGIAGLITKFGGANSHMTIRCAELGIPAAIGVGESVFERLVNASQVELRCGEKLVRPVSG